MSQVSDVAIPDAEVAPSPVRGASLLRRSLRLWRTRIGVALVGVIVLLAIIGPYVAPYGPSTPVGAPNADPSSKAVLGTDYLGQDVLSRVLYGGRSILVMAVIATALGPVFQVIALNLAYLAGGIIVIEIVFNYSGIGGAIQEAVINHDLPVVQALAMLIAAVYVILNLLADVATILVTPRLRTRL